MRAPFVFQTLYGDADAGDHAPALVGPEDLELDLTNPAEPSLLVSCQKRPKEDEPGFIARVILGPNGPVSWRRLDMPAWPAGAAFHPLGISLCAPDRKLYVVNKDRQGGNRVEVFEAERDAIRYVESLLAPDFLTEPNDIVALPGGRLVVTNPHQHPGRFRNVLPDLLKANHGTVVSREDASWRILATEIAFANGVAVDGRGSVYVTATRDGLLQVFSRNNATWAESARLHVEGQPDNLTWADERHLIVASHDSIFAFLLHATTGGATRSPARVFRIDTDARPLAKELLLEHDGKGIGSISTAVLFRDRLYLGQVIEEGIGVAVLA